MAWKMSHSATSPLNQPVEYWQNPGNGYSDAESPAKVVVSGRTVVRGWSCDGKTYEAYARIVAEGWRDPEYCRHCSEKVSDQDPCPYHDAN